MLLWKEKRFTFSFSMVREIFFKGFLQAGEEIHVVIHRHPMTAFKRWLTTVFFGMVLPLVFFWLFPDLWMFALIWGVLGIMRLIYDIIDWYYDCWIVTSLSIIHVIWDGFFNKSADRTEYHYVESIGYEVKGILQTIFNYGTITVEKATGNTVSFLDSISPKKKVEQMIHYQEEFITKKNFRDHRTLKGLMTEMLHHHYREFGPTKPQMRGNADPKQ